MEKIPNIRAHKYSKQILTYLKGEIDSNAVIVCGFNSHLSIKDRSSRHRVKKETLDLNYALHQTDLIGTYGTFHPTAAEYTFFSSEQETFPQIYHVLGHKSLKTSDDWNPIKYLFWPQWYEIRNQQWEENWKVHKYVEIMWYTVEQPMSQRINQKWKKKSWNKWK